MTLYAAPCATGCGEMVPTSTPKPGWYLCPGCARAARGAPARRPRQADAQPVDAPDDTLSPACGAGDDEEATT